MDPAPRGEHELRARLEVSVNGLLDAWGEGAVVAQNRAVNVQSDHEIAPGTRQLLRGKRGAGRRKPASGVRGVKFH